MLTCICKSSAVEMQIGGSQELGRRLSLIADFVRDLVSEDKVENRTVVDNTQHQLLASAGTHIHVQMHLYTHKHKHTFIIHTP